MNNRTTRISTALFFLLTLVMGTGLLLAQQTRTVEGTVLDANDNALPRAIVYLKNARSHSVRTYIAGDDGKFNFHAVDPNVNYDLYADYQGKKSSTRTISSFDSRSEIHMDLKIPIGR